MIRSLVQLDYVLSSWALSELPQQFVHLSLRENASQMRARSVVRHSKVGRCLRNRAAARDLLREADFGGCKI
jgi:hypothetical protein